MYKFKAIAYKVLFKQIWYKIIYGIRIAKVNIKKFIMNVNKRILTNLCKPCSK